MSNKNISAQSGETWRYAAIVIAACAIIAVLFLLLLRVNNKVNSQEVRNAKGNSLQDQVSERQEPNCPFGQICVPPGKTYSVDIQKGEAFDYCVLRGEFQMTVIDKTNELQEVAEVKYGGQDPIFTIMHPSRIEFTTISAEEGRLVFQKCEAL